MSSCLPQRDAPGEVLRHQLEGLHGEADVAVRVSHPLGEVDHRRLHHEMHARPLRRLEFGEERQPFLHRGDRLGGEPAGVLLELAQQRLRDVLQEFKRRPRSRWTDDLSQPRVVGHG